MAIQLTEKAARHAQRALETRGRGIGLRLGVRTTGCSGLAYKLEYVDDEADAGALDHVFVSHGVKVFVDEKSLPYIDGLEMDFAREGLSAGFRFNNPNVKDTCGCGESFRV
jgi:iron-sulfur cluster assembly protein